MVTPKADCGGCAVRASQACYGFCQSAASRTKTFLVSAPQYHTNYIGRILTLVILDTILNTYLWSHVEPATAIACACLMTYGPLFAGVSPRLQSFIGGSKQNLFTKRLINIKLGSSSTGSDSEASQSLGRTMHGQEPADYGGGGGDLLGAKIPKGTAAHGGFNVSVKALSADSRSSSSATEHLSMNPAVGRDSSLV